MLRVVAKHLAPAKSLGVAGKPLISAIQTSGFVSRILGGSKAGAVSLTISDTLVEKTGSKGLSGAAAHLSRAIAVLSRPLAVNSVGTALTDVAVAIAETKSASSVEGKLLHRLALSIKLRALKTILDEKEHLLHVSGAANESDVSTARSAVRDAYADLLNVAPQDGFVQLGLAELLLCEGDAAGALANAESAEKLFKAEAADRALSHVEATPSNSSAASIVAFKLTTALPSVDASCVKSAVLRDTFSALAAKNVNITPQEYNALRSQLEAPSSISDEELVVLAVTLANAEKGQHYMEYFPAADKYKAWHSDASHDVAHAVESFTFGKGVSLSSEDRAAAGKKPTIPFYGSVSELNKLLSEKSEGDFLDAVLAKFGEGPKSSLAVQDAPFWNVMERISHEPHCNFSGGSPASVEHHASLAGKLLKQMGFRTNVTKALALERLGEPHKALELLDAVVSANEYVYMWNALVARGGVRQNLGLVQEADEDFKQVFKLRQNYAHADIPLRDENRTKSMF